MIYKEQWTEESEQSYLYVHIYIYLYRHTLHGTRLMLTSGIHASHKACTSCLNDGWALCWSNLKITVTSHIWVTFPLLALDQNKRHRYCTSVTPPKMCSFWTWVSTTSHSRLEVLQNKCIYESLCRMKGLLFSIWDYFIAIIQVMTTGGHAM